MYDVTITAAVVNWLNKLVNQQEYLYQSCHIPNPKVLAFFIRVEHYLLFYYSFMLKTEI